MKHKLRVLAPAVVLVLALLCSAVALAIPPIPVMVDGAVTIGGASAPDGTGITAWVAGVQRGSATTSGGGYENLEIPGDYRGELAVFKVSGVAGGQVVLPAGDPGVTVNLKIYTLTVNNNPPAGGSVDVSPLGPYPSVSPLTANLDAQPAGGYVFDHWSGNLSGSADPTTLLMNGNKNVTANYNSTPVIEYSLTIDSTPGGSVTIPGEGTFPGYDPGEVQNLVAAADAGYEFDVWTGDVGTIGNVNLPTTMITMNGDYNITAEFALLLPTLCEAIDRGVDWLLAEQNGDGSWGTEGDWLVGQTALALLKLETHATDPECGYGLPTPLDPRYPHRGAVQDGLDYLLDNSYEIAITGSADTNNNGIGVYFHTSGKSQHEPYETGCALMALAASRAPGTSWDTTTYGTIAQDTVDFLAWAQTDGPGNYRGGWGYTYNDVYSDNSITGWCVLGLEYAESPAQLFDCTVPAFVRSELGIWVNYIQCGAMGPEYGGSGYSQPCSWVNTLKTGNLLEQFEFLGDNVNNQRVRDAVDYLVLHWDDANADPGWRGSPASYGATFSIMKGLESFGIDRIDSIDWFGEIAAVLIDQQNPDGSWPACDWSDSGRIISTSWALLTLQKAIAKPPVPAPECDFRAVPRTGFAPLTVLFTSLSTGDVEAWFWKFGDGGTSTQQDPTHRYTKDGKYTVTLEVKGPGGSCNITRVAYIIVSVRAAAGAVVAAPADLASTNLLISHEQVVPGQQVEISINIGNDGGSVGTRTVTLTINGYVEESQVVTVSPGSSKLVVFRVTEYEPGTYQVLVEGKEGVFYVLAPQKANYFSGPLSTAGIIVIVVVAIVLIVAIVFVFRKREM